MSGRYVVRPLAEVDLERLADYISQFSPANAVNFIDAVGRAYETLANSRLLGEVRPTRRPEYAGVRVWRVPGFPNHLIYYRPIDIGIEVLRIVHGARDQDKLL